jgi:hypothetical protein
MTEHAAPPGPPGPTGPPPLKGKAANVVDIHQIKQRLADFQPREAINQNQNIALIVAVVIIAVSGLFIAMRCEGGGGGRAELPREVYYYDTVTEELFVEEGNQLAPITSPEGNPAVRAHVFACGSCKDQAERFVAFYEKYTDQGKRKLQQTEKTGAGGHRYEMAELEEGDLLYSFDAKSWWPADPDAPESMSDKIRSRLTCDNGNDARYCRP